MNTKMSESLTAIANGHGTDKGTAGPTPAWRCHDYASVYEAYLWPLRNEAVTLLEIGIGVPGPDWDAQIARGRNRGGASLRMWEQWLPKARILGADIHSAAYLDSDRVTTFIADQGDPESLRKLAEAVEEADIIIDDGSHRPDHQQITLRALFGILRPGGLYFIEDMLHQGLARPGRSRFSPSVPVLATRDVLAGLMNTGEPTAPHLVGPDVAAMTDWVHLHAPRRRACVRLEWKGHHQPVRPLLRFLEGTEELAVIRKKASAST